ncbi:hypothetical protein BDV38DRAFT_18110 [Aspergillus pseudotamarii]|uniref:Uncharacterized protein n=1 Tax=Aspergillus pseudotamarii TaxID=132259 RepID=A0A5N6T298_ASPPS|nr:uncharacterized protein BDV38DRAFT_18110 [Aspergillus pseudotamarii]KAE8140410.1 hypothetical protein BDV38DRAFT_18110 [Aspergillus pseudotamarii]
MYTELAALRLQRMLTIYIHSAHTWEVTRMRSTRYSGKTNQEAEVYPSNPASPICPLPHIHWLNDRRFPPSTPPIRSCTLPKS